jgi:LysM repeat protein
VCGSNFSPAVASASKKAVSGPRIPEVTLSLPVIFGLAILLLAVGAGVVFAVLRSMGEKNPVAAVQATPSYTPSATATVTITPTETSTPTLAPTWTLEPPIDYKVVANDTCLKIANEYQVSVNSIIIINGLPSDCTLSLGAILKIPRPTPTASPQPTNTLNPTQIIQSECDKVDYVVQDGDSLSKIAGTYGITMASIRTYNSLPSDIVYTGQKLTVPLCEQVVETATPTPIPPYPAPNLLLPADGASFVNAADVISLQWASVGELRPAEAYAVTIEDVTDGNNRKLVEYVTDTKFIVPDTFQPAPGAPHVFRWSILPVRQIGTDKDSGNPIWEPAGAASMQRVFSWVGSTAPVGPTPTP